MPSGRKNMKVTLLGLFVLNLMAILTLFADFAEAKEATVFDVRRPIAMDNDEKPPKDFYVNAGANDGLKIGMIINVNRRQSLYDPYMNKSPGDLVVLVGQLRLIHVQADMSVARLENIEGRQNLPTLDFDAIMVGDKLDLDSAKMAPRKTAALDEGVIQMEVLKTGPLNEADFSSITPTVIAPVATPAASAQAPISSTTN